MKNKKENIFNKIVFIEILYKNGSSELMFPVHEQFLMQGYLVKYFHKTELESLPLTKKTVVRGGISTVRKALDILKCKQPKNIDIPDCIKKYAKRKIWKTTLGKVRKMRNPVFIKPLNHQKLFCGHVFGRSYLKEDIELISTLPNSFPILAQEVKSLKYSDEVRFYILNGRIVNESFYAKEIPEEEIDFVKNIIKDFGKRAPASYCIDVGLIKRSKYSKKFDPILIEVNDGFGMSFQFLNSDNCVVDCIVSRWNELVSNSK